MNPLAMVVVNTKNRKQERFKRVKFSPQGGGGGPAAGEETPSWGLQYPNGGVEITEN